MPEGDCLVSAVELGTIDAALQTSAPRSGSTQEHTLKHFNAQQDQNCPANRFVETDVASPFVAIGSRTEVDPCRTGNLGFQERLHAKNLPKTFYRMGRPMLLCLPVRRDVHRIASSKLSPAETAVRERKGRTPRGARYRGHDGGHGRRRHRTDWKSGGIIDRSV